jgi:hypothetical protein
MTSPRVALNPHDTDTAYPAARDQKLHGPGPRAVTHC